MITIGEFTVAVLEGGVSYQPPSSYPGGHTGIRSAPT